jgi:hypothetical protein
MVRACGQRVFDPSPSDLLRENRFEDKHLEETEVITRMNWVLYQYKLWDDLDAINWKVSNASHSQVRLISLTLDLTLSIQLL